ncbi:response regulator [Atopomonas hussainii]|uniref:response regulator n=1 Tax=Atopomonas hussainii TaxID=1429083 RepID=UPI00090047F1|nr:response regulator [Atopomonas hussainii]
MAHPPLSKPVSILLVDDDDVDVMGIQRAFAKLKILNPIVRARDGLEALELLRGQGHIDHPYLILLDINMPRMNGIETLAALRADPQLANAVVFILTTSRDDQDKLAAYEKHVAGYIVKQNAGDDFLQLISLLDHYWRIVEWPLEATREAT